MNLNLTHLQNFIQVVEWGNVSKAATYLNIAQPALSRQMQALEAAFNTKLLQRRNWGVEPTEDGKLLLDHARRIQKECLSARESVRSNRENPAGSVYLGVPSAYSVSLVPPLIRRMRELYPNIEVHIVEGFSRAIYEWLANGRLDLAILYRTKEIDVERSSPFLFEDLVMLSTPGQFSDATGMALADLSERKVIAPWRPHFLRQILDAKFMEVDVPFVPRLEIDSMRCMIEMARLGEGVVILPPSCVAREISDGRLNAVSLAPRIGLETVLGETPGRHPTRASAILADVLVDLASDLAPTMGWTVSAGA